MFSVLPSYVTLQDVVHLCPDNEAVILHFTCVGMLCRGISIPFPSLYSGETCHSHPLCAHIFQCVGELFSSIEIFVPSLIRLGLNLRNLAYPSLFSGRD